VANSERLNVLIAPDLLNVSTYLSDPQFFSVSNLLNASKVSNNLEHFSPSVLHV